jgi:hypothetical protein
MRDKEFGVVGGAAQKRGILEEMSEPDVAVAAEESAHHAGPVGVIDTERPLPLPAHETQAALALDHPVVILQRQSVFPLQLALPPGLRCPEQLGAVCGVGGAAVSPVRVDLFAIGRVPSALVGKPPLATCRILCISFSFVWTGHGALAGVAPAWRRAMDNGRRAARAARRVAGWSVVESSAPVRCGPAPWSEPRAGRVVPKDLGPKGPPGAILTDTRT